MNLQGELWLLLPHQNGRSGTRQVCAKEIQDQRTCATLTLALRRRALSTPVACVVNGEGKEHKAAGWLLLDDDQETVQTASINGTVAEESLAQRGELRNNKYYFWRFLR